MITERRLLSSEPSLAKACSIKCGRPADPASGPPCKCGRRKVLPTIEIKDQDSASESPLFDMVNLRSPLETYGNVTER